MIISTHIDLHTPWKLPTQDCAFLWALLGKMNTGLCENNLYAIA